MSTSLEEVASALSTFLGGKPPFAGRAGQREAAVNPFERAGQLVARRTLTPWAEAALADRVIDQLEADLVDVKAAAPTVLDCLAKGRTEDELAARGFPPSLVRAAVIYAAWIVLEAAREDRSRLSGDRVVSERLPPEDAEAMDRFLIYRTGPRSSTSVDRLYRHWVRLVGRLETEYDDLFEEYCNELDRRDLLEEASTFVSPAGRRVLDDFIGPVDERFWQATSPRATPMLAGKRWRPQRWWWYRRPRRPGPSLRGHLDERELTDLPSPPLSAEGP